MIIDLELLLQAVEQKLGLKALFELVQKGMRAKVSPETLEAFLERSVPLRGAYELARNQKKPKELRLRNLAKCIRSLGLEFVADTRLSPWNQFVPGSTVVVFIGIRQVSIREVSAKVKQRAVGARDVESLIELSNLLGSQLRTSFKLEPHLVAPDVSDEEADALVYRTRERKDVGAIFVLGSPVTNRMCDSVARAILGQEMPKARFRWSHEQCSSVLSEANPCARDEEGIATVGVRGTQFPRMHDDEVHQAHLDGRRPPFPDCGILMLDCRSTPFLIVAAGHGGCGTKACVRALSDQEQIAQRLANSNQNVFEVVLAQRIWSAACEDSPDSLIDSLDLRMQKGWSFGWELDAPNRQ